jgi:hypothetical protein
MIKKISVTIIALLIAAPAFAQGADPAFMQRAITVLQQQRNNALDAQAAAEAKASGLTEDLNKALAKIKELDKPAEHDTDKK